MRPPPIFVGTSGWIYPHWRGRFYPAELAASRWLEYLAARLSSVEINGTFYSLTTPRACERWREAVPPEFPFAVKGSRYITHMKKLADVGAALANFFASGILRLGRQLGPILWQLPPGLPFRRDLAERFFSRLPEDLQAAERLARRHDRRVTGRASLTAPDGRHRRILYAVEPRHASWMEGEAAEILRKQEVALVWADTAGEHPETTLQTTRALAYVRLHGEDRLYEGHYPEATLAAWASRARAWSRAGIPVFVYFDNDRDAAAAVDAVRLTDMVRGRARLPVPRTRRADLTPRERPAHFGFRPRTVRE